MTQLIYYLQNRHWQFLYHFMIYMIGGLHLIPDSTDGSKIHLYLPYLSDNLSEIDFRILLSLWNEVSSNSENSDVTFEVFAGIYNNNTNKSTTLHFEILNEIVKSGKYVVHTTLNNEDLLNSKIVVNFGAIGEFYNPDKDCYVFLRNLFISENNESILEKGKRIYISRKNAKNFSLNNGQKTRYVLNEEELQETLDINNIKQICLEDYSFIEKINIFRTSELIISPHGSALVFSLFSDKNSTIIELIPDSGGHVGINNITLAGHYKKICSCLNINFIRFTKMKEYDQNKNMVIDIEEFKKCLQNVI